MIQRFYDPKGKSIKIDVINNIPYLSPSETEVVAGRSDLPRVYPALPAPIVVHEKVVAIGESHHDEADELGLGELDSICLENPVRALDRTLMSLITDQSPKVLHHHLSPELVTSGLRRGSIRHLMIHLPKNPYCDACQRAKTENIKSYRQDSPRDKGFEKFGEHVTVDTMVLHGLGDRGNNGEATSWLEAVPVKGRTNSDTLRAVNAFSMDTERRYAPPEVREIYCDKAREFISVCKRVGISVAHSTPGMPRTNAIAESKVKLVLHGARVALRQAGLSAKFWPYACRHFCHAQIIEMREGECAYLARFGGTQFDGMVLPFGCLVDFFPTPARKRTRRSPKDDVVLGDGEEYATPAPDDGLVEIEVGFDDDGYLEWINDGEAKEGADITLKGNGQFSSYQRVGKFSPTSKPGIFLGYHVRERW